MKQLKFLMVAFTLLMGISMTSCIGESDPTVTWVAFGQVTSYFPTVIKGNDGVEYTATNDLSGQDLNLGDYVYFQYSYNSDLQKVDQNTKKIDATITIVQEMAYSSSFVASDKGEGYENLTILYMGDGSNYDSSNSVNFFYYDKSKIILPIALLIKDASIESLAKHNFSLVYNEEEVEAGDTEIVFYLRHKSSETDSKKGILALRMFDISRALEEFKEIAGNKPTKVVIYANETKDNTTDALDKKKDELTKYSMNYSFED